MHFEIGPRASTDNLHNSTVTHVSALHRIMNVYIQHVMVPRSDSEETVAG